MNSDTPTTPSLPTTAISAEAPFSITYSSETMAVVGKVHMAERAARLVQHLAERQLHRLELRLPALPIGGGQRREQLVFVGRLRHIRWRIGASRRARDSGQSRLWNYRQRPHRSCSMRQERRAPASFPAATSPCYAAASPRPTRCLECVARHSGPCLGARRRHCVRDRPTAPRCRTGGAAADGMPSDRQPRRALLGSVHQVPAACGLDDMTQVRSRAVPIPLTMPRGPGARGRSCT